MVEMAQRVVPGAPPSQVKAAPKKKKQKNAANGDRSHSQETISRAANEASLMEKAPSRDKVNDSVKIQAKDLAEEAERNGAIAAAQIIIEKENGSTEKENKSALQVILTKRIKVLSKKLQRAVTYEALEEEKLNADMKRIIASKPALEAGVAELTEASKALEIAEQEADKHTKLQTKLAVEAARKELVAENEHKGAVLFQFLHLYSLTQPPSIPSFAPPPLPAVLAQATGQEIAAVGKLYADLSSSAEVAPLDAKYDLLGKLSSGSKDNILEGVSFQRVLDLVEGLSTLVVEQPEAERETAVEDEEAAVPSQPEKAAPAGGILFMQQSEIDEQRPEAPLEAAEEVKQAEPEGGATDGVPASAIKGGATERGKAGAKGIIPGGSALPGKEDGSAQAQVEEPMQTTQVGGPAKETSSASKTAAQILNGPGPKSIDWANDDDDWGDMIMQLTPDPKLAATPIASEATKVNGMSNGSTKTEHKPQAVKGLNNQQQGNVQRKNAAQEGPHTAAASATPAPPAAKGTPEVDEDGFVLASSKRSKMQQQHQSMNRNANRGGRGAFRGQGGRGGYAPRGGSFGDSRGRGRGRGGRQGAEQSSEA